MGFNSGFKGLMLLSPGCISLHKGKIKHFLDRPLGFQEFQAPRIKVRMVRMSALLHRPPLPPEEIPGTHFRSRQSRPHGHSAAGRIESMKNLNYPIGNRTRDFLAINAVI